jgi:CDP-diacylglycerol--glycerol-3-phosphate 3-phosphatidyltransferase
MSKLETSRKSLGGRVTLPIVRLLARTPLTPDAVTWLGFVITLGAAALIVLEHLLAAGIVVIVAGAFDMLDGALARLTGRVSRFGAILDSTLDRLSEAALLLALLAVFTHQGRNIPIVLVGFTLVGSLMVSYLRARMEGLGLEGREGWFTRPERVIIIALGLILSRFFNYALLVGALGLVAVFSYITVGQRLYSAWRQTKHR